MTLGGGWATKSATTTAVDWVDTTFKHPAAAPLSTEDARA